MAKKKGNGDELEPKADKTQEAAVPDCALCLMGSSQDPSKAHTLGTVQHPA